VNALCCTTCLAQQQQQQQQGRSNSSGSGGAISAAKEAEARAVKELQKGNKGYQVHTAAAPAFVSWFVLNYM
jgi:hypothetical protein